MKGALNLGLVVCFVAFFQLNAGYAAQNIDSPSSVKLGDPFIMLHENTYYAYGTVAPDGIAVYVSDDLHSWKDAPGKRLALHKDDSWGDRWFWAPEVYAIDGKFYMYYTANEHICVAVSDSPLGPFRQELKQPMLEGEKAIDNSLFIDKDGKPYLFFDRFNDGLNIWVAELKDDLMTIKPETMRKCIHVSQEWETIWPRVNEGAFVVEREGTYYLTYSANSYESPFYGIGFATANHPMGPWTKYERNPIFQKPGDLVGVGHSAMFTDKDGQLRIVFHSHHSETEIHPRIMHIGAVTFAENDGQTIMQIDENYITPRLAAPGQVRIEWDPNTLQRLAPRDGRQLSYAGYPRVKRLHDGTAVAVYEAQGNTELIWSADTGKTWSSPVITFHWHTRTDARGNDVRVNVANPEFIELQNGDWITASNYRPTKNEVAPFAIAVSRSSDRGKTWSAPQVIYEAEPRFHDGCWEPAFLQLPDGTLQVYFANEAPYTDSDEQEIAMLASADNGKTWNSEPRTVSFRADRRDGMPVPLLVGNEILVAIEDNKVGQFKPYIVRTAVADNWREPVAAGSSMREYALKDPLPDSVYAGAPYLARLATGEILLAYQTTRGRGTDWEKSTMEVAIGDKSGRNFERISQPFPVPLDREAKWNSIAVWDDTTVVATSATNFDGGNIGAWMMLGRIAREQHSPTGQGDTYTNPVFEPILADPTVFRDPLSGYFYAYGTEDDWGDGEGRRLVPILRSGNLVDWQVVGQAFNEKPHWKEAGGLWAPDVNHVNGKYYLYYAYSTWGDRNPGIGVAVAEKPTGPFVDHGKLFSSIDADVPNSIDAFYFEEDGSKYLFWGSFSNLPTQGTYGVRLADDGLSVPNLGDKFKIAAGDYEAVMIHKRGGYYYFFGSKGSCCEGANSQYHVLVARSTNLEGPYLDREGKDIAQRGNGTLFIRGNDVFVGPGHNARLIADDEGTDWFIYHGIDKSHGKVASGASRRALMLDRVTWRDGWPTIDGGMPSTTPQEAPVFTRTSHRP